MRPCEVDLPEAVKEGQPKGVKHAAVRKLHHELGIEPGTLDVAKFTFVTRVHYFAADIVTHGPDAPWGEHEIDYLLVYKLDGPGESLKLNPHPEEVRATKWVTEAELRGSASVVEGRPSARVDGAAWTGTLVPRRAAPPRRAPRKALPLEGDAPRESGDPQNTATTLVGSAPWRPRRTCPSGRRGSRSSRTSS